MSIIDFVKIIDDIPAALSQSERLFLYSSILSFRPKNCLEIGADRGGSTKIISLALDKCGKGEIYSIDPNHQISDENFKMISHRVTLIHGYSPAAIKKAYEKSGKLFDFVFVDGNHDFVAKDLKGFYPLLAPEALVIFHDANYLVVRMAVDSWIKEHSENMLDHGIVDKSCNKHYQPPYIYGGLRAVTFRRKYIQNLFI